MHSCLSQEESSVASWEHDIRAHSGFDELHTLRRLWRGEGNPTLQKSVGSCQLYAGSWGAAGKIDSRFQPIGPIACARIGEHCYSWQTGLAEGAIGLLLRSSVARHSPKLHQYIRAEHLRSLDLVLRHGAIMSQRVANFDDRLKFVLQLSLRWLSRPEYTLEELPLLVDKDQQITKVRIVKYAGGWSLILRKRARVLLLCSLPSLAYSRWDLIKPVLAKLVSIAALDQFPELTL